MRACTKSSRPKQALFVHGCFWHENDAYNYNNNGNVKQKTDPPGSVTYAYDALNHNATVNYSNTTVPADLSVVFHTYALTRPYGCPTMKPHKPSVKTYKRPVVV